MKQLSECRILIVDDNKVNVEILAKTLKNQYKTGSALTGQKAVEYTSNHPVDLILLDIMMPEMDGFEVCRQLKANPATWDIPIIFISAIGETAHKTRGFKNGAVDYVTKPFDMEEIRARVKTHLSLKIATEALKDQNTLLEEKIKRRTRELIETQIEIVDRLSLAAEHRDEETGNHVKRMSRYCFVLSSAAGLSPAECHNLSIAAILHDVGKIGVSDTIMLKPAKLTADEMKIMKTHTDIGKKLLSGSKCNLLQTAEIIALTHHERWDGSGYPEGLTGEAIPLAGRIAGICDVFDALVSKRIYKKAWSMDQALDEINAKSGIHFDPFLVSLFVALRPKLESILSELS